MKRANVLVMQAGGSTPVLNRSLYGVAREALGRQDVGEVYGSRRGLEGLLSGEVTDLRGRAKSWWDRAARTPGAILGSSRHRLSDEDLPAVLSSLDRFRVACLLIIGGNDSAETALRIASETSAAGRPVAVVHVPKTIDNDLASTDHSPGYGSAARFVALATMGAGRDAETMGEESPVTVIEVMGRDAGWLAASAALGKREPRDAPHVVCVPEVPVEEDRFLDLLEAAYRRYGFAVAVVAENARGAEEALGGRREPWYVDDFGHTYYQGAGRHLSQAAGRRLNVRVRYERPGTIQRAMAACVSSTDAREAELVGREAVRRALGGATGQMVTLARQQGQAYSCATGMAPLEEVAGRVRRLPEGFFDRAASLPTQPFLDYARPLIGAPLPRFDRLDQS